jgi:hypothetical protein
MIQANQCRIPKFQKRQYPKTQCQRSKQTNLKHPDPKMTQKYLKLHKKAFKIQKDKDSKKHTISQ